MEITATHKHTKTVVVFQLMQDHYATLQEEKNRITIVLVFCVCVNPNFILVLSFPKIHPVSLHILLRFCTLFRIVQVMIIRLILLCIVSASFCLLILNLFRDFEDYLFVSSLFRRMRVCVSA